VYADTSGKTFCVSKWSPASSTYWVASTSRPDPRQSYNPCASAGSPPAVFGQNLLTANQANPTTLGAFYAFQAVENPAGAYRPSVANGWVSARTEMPVTPGRRYTVSATLNIGGGARGAYASIYWYRANNSLITATSGSTVPPGSTGTSTVSHVAPADAHHALVHAFHTTSYTGPTTDGPWTVSNVGFWEGPPESRQP
jgi:hypothetical protein